MVITKRKNIDQLKLTTMKAVHFKGVNLVLAEDQPEYNPLPVCFQGDNTKAMTSCYKLTLFERVKLLFKGRVYVTQLTFGQSFQPQRVELEWQEPTCRNCGAAVSDHKKPQFFCPSKLN